MASLSSGPGRARDPDVTRRVLEAARLIYAESGAEKVTLNAVAARAGVGNSALYRRWSDPAALLADALNEPKGEPMPRGSRPAIEAGPEEPRQGGRRLELIRVAQGVVSKSGVADFTLASVAAAAGISAPTLYAHFANRTDLLEHVLEQTARSYAADMAATDNPEARFDERLRTRIRRWVRTPETELRLIHEAVLHMPESPRVAAAARDAMEAWLEFAQGVLQCGIQRREVRPDVDVPAAVGLLTTSLLGVELAASTGLSTQDLAAQAEQLVDMFVAYTVAVAPGSR